MLRMAAETPPPNGRSPLSPESGRGHPGLVNALDPDIVTIGGLAPLSEPRRRGVRRRLRRRADDVPPVGTARGARCPPRRIRPPPRRGPRGPGCDHHRTRLGRMGPHAGALNVLSATQHTELVAIGIGHDHRVGVGLAESTRSPRVRSDGRARLADHRGQAERCRNAVCSSRPAASVGDRSM